VQRSQDIKKGDKENTESEEYLPS